MPADALVTALVVLAAALASAGVSRALLPILRSVVMAHPNERSSHSVPTPQGGGIGVLAGLLAGAVAGELLRPQGISGEGLVAMLCVSLAFGGLGAVDDWRSLSVRLRLALQALLATAFVIALPTFDALGAGVPGPVERVLCVFAIVATVNIVNFIDGSDLITAAHAVPAFAGFAVLLGEGGLAETVALAALGSVAGFAVLNWPPARLFLGDMGSTPIGFLLAAFATFLALRGSMPAAVALLAYPMLDGVATLFDRWRRGEDLAKAHRDHAYQVARRRGVTPLAVAAAVFAQAGAAAVLTVLLLAWFGPVGGYVAAAASLFLAAVLLRWFRRGRLA